MGDEYPAAPNGDGIGAPSHSGAGPHPAATEAPKTRACANCARLKMKCRWPASGVSQTLEASCIRYAHNGAQCDCRHVCPDLTISWC